MSEREKLRVFATGSCEGIADVLQGLGAHDEVELVGSSEQASDAIESGFDNPFCCQECEEELEYLSHER